MLSSQRELQGTDCMGLEHEPPAKQEIACTRSFGHAVLDLSVRLNVLQFLTIRRYLVLMFVALIVLLLVTATWI